MALEPFAFALYLHNRPGVLNRVALVFSRRGWNIDSVSISAAEDGNFARCNLIAVGPASGVNNVTAQLNKLVDVISARREILDHRIISREVVLIKVAIDPQSDVDLRQSAHELDCQLVDVSSDTAVFQFVGTAEHTRMITDTIARQYTIVDVIRSGAVSMPRTQNHPADVANLGPNIRITAQGHTVE